MNWWKNLKGSVKKQEPLKKHTSFRIGGPARFFVEPKDSDDLKALIVSLKKHTIPFSVIGGGSNLLVSDKGVERVVISLSSPAFKELDFQAGVLDAGAGRWLGEIVMAAKKRGFSGLEFLSGIPGTLGGALVMNAGISKKSSFDCRAAINIGDLVENVTVMSYNGSLKVVSKEDITFGYRRSSLSKYIVLGARLALREKDAREISRIMRHYRDYRRQTQDLSFPSAGCVFKNPQSYSAGQLIDSCGLKGEHIRDAYISGKHANFLLNRGNAKASDVLALMGLVKSAVKKKYKLTLQPEIKIWQ
ncbi:MAG: UDP-N-acetylmuramate dehydrogenase [Candidatus Omnitrophota bacterium]|jgi:UDP-N-acetylmuramate dehydrogenase